jgi:hypothetical protein
MGSHNDELKEVQSMDEAVEWAERFPFEAWSQIYPGEYGAEVEIEIRQVFVPEPSASNQRWRAWRERIEGATGD